MIRLFVLIAAVSCAVGLNSAERSGPPMDATNNVAFAPTLPLAMCFAPDTDPDYIRRVQQQMLDEMGATIEYNLTARWPGTPGTPVTLTYSFPPDGTETDDGPNQLHELFSQADFGFEVDGVPKWKMLFREMFDRWEEITGNTNIEVGDDGATWPGSPGAPGVRGDIRIVCAPIDGPGDIWAFNYFPAFGGDMQIDSADVFVIDLPTNNFRRFRNLIGHEHGHGLGMFHVCPDSNQTGGATKLMEPFIVSAFDGPQLDDILGSQTHYGDRFEPNNSLATATDLESIGLVSGPHLTINELSLHGLSDFDYFSFVAEAGSNVVQIQAAPQGSTYLEGPQVSGECEPGTPFDSLRQAVVWLELLNPSGAVIASSNGNGLGGVEAIENLTLMTAGKYTIRVRTSDFLSTQLYRLRATIELAGIVGDLNGDGMVDGTDIAILLASWGTSGAASGADLNGDNMVNGADLAILLANWTG